MSTSPPPLPAEQAPRPVATLAYDAGLDNWVPSVLRLFSWIAVIAGGAMVFAASVEVGAYLLGGSAGGRLFAGPGRFAWVWGVIRIAAWVASALLLVAGFLGLARARAARVTFLVWACAAVAFGAAQWVLVTLFFVDLRNQSQVDHTVVVANSAQNLAWFVTTSVFPAIIAIFMLSSAARRWFESR